MKTSIQTDSDIYQLFSSLQSICIAKADAVKAVGMKSYMKNKYDFYGISAPDRKQIIKELRTKNGTFSLRTARQLVDLLWGDTHREMQYLAVDILTPFAKKLTPDDLPMLEKLIVTKSWWDTVDGIAPAIAGTILRKFPESKETYAYRWMQSDNIWLQRSAIIFQLKYGKDTDWDLLSAAILKNDTSKEFFVRKGQGWALRQYSRIDPLKVKNFVDANSQLSGLAKREALRLLGGD
jgi:3-methyladenine DNA glycosylase AlkD